MKKYNEKIMSLVFFLTALASIIAVFLICFFLCVNGLSAFKEIGFFKFIFGKTWAPSNTPASYGILPMILGSFYVTAGAILIGCPIGIFTAVFMAKNCPKPLYKVLKPAINLLAGIPSVVYGFFGIIVVVPLVRTIFGGPGSSILAASILLGIMILPTIIAVSESALRAVPEHYYQGALALGATHIRSLYFVVLPAAKSAVTAAVILGFGRAIGETMAVIMVAGNQARMPSGILNGVRTLTSNIVIEMGYAAQLHREALIATALVLFVFILIINMLFSLIKGKAN